MLQRIWTGIVGAVAGAAAGLVASIVLLQTGVQLDGALNAVWVVAIVGGILGFIFGGRKSNQTP